jgi:hypothetical protein
MRDWWALHCTCRFFRDFFSHDRFLGRMRLPVSPEWPKEFVVSELAWLLRLPDFGDSLSHVPWFRQSAAMARLVQGALRALEYQRGDEHDFVIATIQPSQQWSSTHIVLFRRASDGLWWTGCRCRNG